MSILKEFTNVSGGGMNGPKRTLDEKLKTIIGTLTTISGLISALLALVPQFQASLNAFRVLSGVSPHAWWLISGVLMIIGYFALRDGLTQRSRLLRPEVLLLQADKPQHLTGRAEDISQLAALCKDYPQIHLVGESGVGKTALIRAGLCPKLKTDPVWFPIYLVQRFVNP